MYVEGVGEIPVDYEAELRMFSWENANWDSPYWDGKKLQASSPFREDRRPSFYVWLQDEPLFNAKAGQWGDSGADENGYIRGSFPTLLAYLRNESIDETIDYLIAKYCPEIKGDRNAIHESVMDAVIQRDRSRQTHLKPMDPSILDRFDHPCDYLIKRGIDPRVMRAMRCGYDPESRSVTLPWFSPKGDLVNIKYRRIDSKFFWYTPIREGAPPIRSHLYGIDVIHRKGCDAAVIVEAEIDALYVMSAGYPAVAVGGSKFSKEKAGLIKRSPIKRLIIATDNDAAGRALRRQIVQELRGYVRLFNLWRPVKYKDVNDIPMGELKALLWTRKYPVI